MPRSPRILLCTLAVGLLAGCASPAAPAPPPTAQTRTVTTERGPVAVPAAPRSVVALDEYAALNALAVGVTPKTVFGGLSSQIGAAVLAGRGIGVVPAPTMITSPDLEAIAATRPDVIVLTSSGAALDATYPRLSAIAPTVVLPFEGPWRGAIETAGAAFGAQDRATRLIDVLTQRIAAVQQAVTAGQRTMAILGSFQGLLYSPAPANPGSKLVAETGFTRPAAELAAASGASASTIPVSAETLAAHEADVVVVLDGSIYDAAAVQALPTFTALPAARERRTARAEGEMWSGGTALATWWMLDDLDRLARGDLGLGTRTDAAARAAALDAAAR